MFKKILIPIDLAHKDQVDSFLQAAKKLSGPDTQVKLLYVDTIMEHRASSPQLSGDDAKAHNQIATEQLRDISQRFSDEGITVGTKIRTGSTYDQILIEAKKFEAEAIIIMAHRPDFSSYFIGTTAARVVRHADCSVFVMRYND